MDLSSKRVVVMGLGRFGGGVGVARHLANLGARVLVTDLLPANQLSESLAKLAHLPIQFRLGQHQVQDFTEAELIVVNPAVDRRGNRFLEAATAAGIPQTSEIRLAIESLPNRHRTIAITGTAGKSTVTTMIGHIMSRALGKDRAFTGGNLGGSLLDRLPTVTRNSWIILELSSFMLEDLNECHWSPHIAVVTNLWANHLDRHETVQAYAAAKQAILEYQGRDDHAVLGPGLDGSLCPRTGQVHSVTNPPDPAIALAIPGQHNQLNAAIAVQAAKCAAVDARLAVEALGDFAGLPHRLQFVGEYKYVRYYNDSKATTPQAAQLAITSFQQTPVRRHTDCQVHVIVGGYDKGTDLTSFGQFAGEHCCGIYTIGATGNTIADAAMRHMAKVVRCNTLDRAVEQACRNAERGGVVLLSPGCASWDQFENYEQRGAAFTSLILKRIADPSD